MNMCNSITMPLRGYAIVLHIVFQRQDGVFLPFVFESSVNAIAEPPLPGLSSIIVLALI